MERDLKWLSYKQLDFDPPSTFYNADKCNLIEGEEYQLIGISC